MKMKIIQLCLVLLVLQSCTSQTKNKGELEKEKMNQKSTVLEPFDLANVTLNENVKDVLSSTNLSEKDTIKSDQLTLIGNEKLSFISDKLLVFNNVKLDGKSKHGVNNLMLHFGKVDKEIGAMNNEKDDVLGMCQLTLYSEEENDLLFKNLNDKFSKAIFHTVKEGYDADVVDNNLVPTKNKYKQKVYIWESKGIVYFYFTSKIENQQKEDRNCLFIFKKDHKEWLEFIDGLGFPFTDEVLKSSK